MKKSLLRQGKEDKPKGWFSMRHGNLEAKIVPLAVDGKCVIGISLRLGDGYRSMAMLFDGETLEPDISTLEKYRKDKRRKRYELYKKIYSGDGAGCNPGACGL